MPVYEFTVSAKIYVRMEGETPEKACENLESLMDDFYMQMPCGGHEIKFGNHIAEVWANDTKPTLKRQMPEGYDPINPPRFSMSEYMKMCLEPQELTQEEADELDRILESGEARYKRPTKEFLGKDLPEANKEEVLKKHPPQ